VPLFSGLLPAHKILQIGPDLCSHTNSKPIVLGDAENPGLEFVADDESINFMIFGYNVILPVIELTQSEAGGFLLKLVKITEGHQVKRYSNERQKSFHKILEAVVKDYKGRLVRALAPGAKLLRDGASDMKNRIDNLRFESDESDRTIAVEFDKWQSMLTGLKK
jgi:hypothetical protein